MTIEQFFGVTIRVTKLKFYIYYEFICSNAQVLRLYITYVVYVDIIPYHLSYVCYIISKIIISE